MRLTQTSRQFLPGFSPGNIACLGIASVALTLVITTLVSPSVPVGASDHIDSPTVAQDRGADLDDTYAFLDPNDNSKVVLIMSTQGFIVPGEHFGMAIFDHNIRYRFEIENTGDARPDQFIDVTYAKGVGRTTYQVATIKLPNGKELQATTTVANHEGTPPPQAVFTDAATGVSFFAGLAEDPFFLDDTSANRFVASSLQNPGHPNKAILGERGRDTYAGYNVLITAVSVPAAMLKGTSNVIGINSVTQRRATQTVMPNGEVQGSGDWVTVDRDGNPLVNNGLIPPARKDEYNGASTEDDANGKFQADIVQSLKNLGTDDAHIAMLADVVVKKGDILRLDLSVPNKGPQGGNNPDGGFGKMGGRRLVDDVVDMVFTVINNGEPLGDNVNANDVPFRDAFPFVADPVQPFPPGNNPDDRTRQ